MGKTPYEMLISGDFNDLTQKPEPGGSLLIRLHKNGVRSIYWLRVRDLYKPTQVIMDQGVIDE